MNRISLINQEGSLKSYFPESTVTRTGETRLTWVHSIRPSPLSGTYKIKLHYVKDKGVNVFVLDPILKLAPGKVFLPHVYSTTEQRLCLYYPTNREWHVGMLYVHTLIPWACEWLLHYEIWSIAGDWRGGGIVHESEAEKQAQKAKEILDELNKKEHSKND